jgi:hypothetical protein
MKKGIQLGYKYGEYDERMSTRLSGGGMTSNFMSCRQNSMIFVILITNRRMTLKKL